MGAYAVKIRSSIQTLGLPAVLAMVALACGQEAASNVGGAGAGGAGPELAGVDLYIFDFSEPPTEVPLEGAAVCQLNADNCVFTDSRGHTRIEFPRQGQEVAFTIEHEGYGPWVASNVVDEKFPEEWPDDEPLPARFPLYNHELLASIAEDLGVRYPWERGMVGLLRWPSPHPGVKFIPVGPTADAVGLAFYFDDETWSYSLEQTESVNVHGLGDFPLAEGGFAEVEPGVHQFELGGTAGVCAWASWGWYGDGPNRIRIPVLEGYTTYGSMRCEDP